MPRVAIIHCGFTYSGGGERLVLEEVRALRERGFTVDCYAPVVDERACFPDFIDEIRPVSLFRQLPRWFPFRDALQMAAASILAPALALLLPRYDVIVGANQPGAWIAWVVSKLRGRPYLVYLNQPCRLIYPREIDIETGWQTKRDYQLLNALIQRARGFVRWADWVSVRGAHRLLVDGMFIGQKIADVYRRDVTDCPAGCRVEPATATAEVDRRAGSLTVNGTVVGKPFVLLTNRHYPQKRFDFAIEAMAHLRRAGVEHPLVITGAFTGYTAQLRVLCDELGLDDAVRFVGEVGEGDLARLYTHAAAYVYPSPEEDFGMGVVEAMGQELPVVAWRHGGPTVTVADGETGLLATPYSIEDFADKIRLLLEDAPLARRMGAAGLRRARDLFSWERHATILQSAIEATSGAAPTPVREEPPREVAGRRRYTAVWEKRRLISSLAHSDRVLDVGAGGGEYLGYLFDRARTVVAVDSDAARIEELRRRFGHVRNIHIVHAALPELPFRNEAFDLVWASEVLEHLPTLVSLDELERVSRRRIVATIPSPTGPYRYLDRSHVLRYSIGGLQRHLRQRSGWSYALEGLGLCLPQWVGLDGLRNRWLRTTRRRPWAAWTLLIRGERAVVPAALALRGPERVRAHEAQPMSTVGSAEPR